MIPSLPETISGTHVEYFPLSAAFLASAFINSYNSYYRMGASDGNPSMRVSDTNDKLPCAEPSTKSLPLPAAFSHYFRGCDLHYAPHIHVPAASSVQNCSTSDVTDVKTLAATN